MLSYASVTFDQQEINNVMDVFNRNWFSSGYYTQRFERELADWWGMNYAIAVNSGSSANFIAVQALGLEKGSRVITTPGGAFPTTISPLLYHNLRPVFVDVKLKTLCINEEMVEKEVRNSRAIMFAHTLGRTPNMDKLFKIKNRYGLKMIEDCCDGVGTTYDNRKVGTYGDLATVSFYPAHHMTTGGEGGAILTNSKSLYRKCISIRDWGRDCRCEYNQIGTKCENRYFKGFDHRYYYTNLGLNFKMSEFQAAFGLAQIYKLDKFIQKRKENYKRLCEGLGIEVDPEISPFALPLYYQNKEKASKLLEEKNIQVRSLFSGNILKHPAYWHLNKGGKYPNSDLIHKHFIFIGVHPQLTDLNIEYMIESIKAINEHLD